MTKTQRFILYAFILAFGIVWINFSADSNKASTAIAPQEGFIAPDFNLSTLAGETFTLSSLKGQAIIINLWATWCPPCRAEMPAMQKLYEEYKNQGLIILAVNMTYQDTSSDIAPFINKYGLTFPILLDETGEIARLYQLNSLPSSYFINRAGIISEVVIGGPMSEALLRTRIEKILQ